MQLDRETTYLQRGENEEMLMIYVSSGANACTVRHKLK